MISENSSYQFHGYAHTVALKEWTTLVIIQLNQRERESGRGGGRHSTTNKIVPSAQTPTFEGKR